MRYLFFSFIHNVLIHPLLFIADVLDALVDACLRFKGNTLLFAMPLVYAAQGITWLHDWSGNMMVPADKEPWNKLPPDLQKIADNPPGITQHGGIASVAHVKASDFNDDGFAKTMAIALKALDDQREGKDFTESVASQLSERSAADYEKANAKEWEAWKIVTRRDEV